MSQRSEREIEIFNVALELPSGERAAYLKQACDGEPNLLCRVEELLREVSAAGAFLENPAYDEQPLNDKFSWPMAAEAKPGDRIGQYKLVQQIGEGGCGVVYMAEQVAPIRRRVALKVIKLGMDTKNVIARFEAERQALALMDHPHIARVLDVGATESGRPYFVMELVRGVKITDYCDEHNLSTRDRLELFMQVCRAVQHAHQKGVIHRDLKPSNILVTSNDGEPMPKVIDFGIAKAAQGKLTDRTVVTAFEQFIGTPAYMSPEQAELSALDIDTRSDIYSLGVLLYELLTGQTPFDGHLLGTAGLDEIRRTICEKEPERPSTRLNSMTQAALTIIAKRRQLDAPKLIHLVNGDLDWIVMKALEKNRSRRYETANGFAADIQRYLKNEPVMARPPGKFYSFQKMVRRHKIAFAVGTLAILALVVCLGAAVTALVLINSAKKGTTEELRSTYLADARATRVGGQPGRRSASLAIVKKAADIRPGPDVRDEAIACLAVSDLEVTKQIVIKGHARNEMAKVDFSLEHYAFGNTNGNVIIRSSSNDAVTATLPGPGFAVMAVGGFSPSGRYLSVRYWRDTDGENDWVWDLTNQTAPIRLSQKTTDTNRWNLYFANDFSGDDRFFCASMADGSILVFDLPSGKEIKRFSGPHPFNHLNVDPAGVRIACSSRDDPAIYIRDLVSGKNVMTLNGPAGVSAAAWSLDGKRLAVGGMDYKIYVWDVGAGSQVVLPGHSSLIMSLAFNRAGNVLASTSFDDVIHLWNPESGRESTRYHGGSWNIQFSADDKQLMGWQDMSRYGSLAVGGSLSCKVINVPLQNKFQSLPAFSADGRMLAVIIDDEVYFWEAETGRKAGSFPLKAGDALLFPPDGKSLITVDRLEGVRERTVEVAASGATTIFRIGHPRPIFTAGVVQDASLSRDGRYMAFTQQTNSQAVILDLGTRSGSVTLTPHPLVNRVAVSPDGLWVATGSFYNSTVKIWDARTGDLVRSFSEPARTFVSFSPDGHWLSTSSSEYKLWEVGSWQQKGPTRAAPREDATSSFTAFTSDGRMMARTDSDKIQLLEVPSARCIATLESPGGSVVLKCQFSPDGTRLAGVQVDKQVQLWDLRRLREELAQMHLDWDQPPYLESPRIAPDAPLAFEVEPATNSASSFR